MRTTARVLLVLFISVPWLGCKNQNQPQVIQGTGDEISAEQIAIEEEELETTE